MDTECFVAPGFEKVLDTFKQNLADGLDKGGSFSAYYKGQLVVNVWGGLADPEKQTPWKKDTLGVFWSATKGVVAIVVAHLVDRGLLSYSDKISKHWPEFDQKGKGEATVSDLLTHGAGLVQLDGKWALGEFVDDYPKFEKRMAEQDPYWKPGSGENGYHSLTFALYLDPIVRRVDPKKRSLAQYFDEEFAKPLGLDFFIGLPVSLFDRSATLALLENIDYKAALKELMKNSNPKYIQRKYADGSPTDMADFLVAMNKPDWRAIPCGSSHGFGTAESLAKLHGILANGGVFNGKQVLSEKSISALEEPALAGVDQMMGMIASRGMGTALMPIVVNDNFDKPLQMFGHHGFGGSMGYGDRSTKLGVCYTTNYMAVDAKSMGELQPRFTNLLYATYDCINAIEGSLVNRKVYMYLGGLENDKKAKKK